MPIYGTALDEFLLSGMRKYIKNYNASEVIIENMLRIEGMAGPREARKMMRRVTWGRRAAHVTDGESMLRL
jgi:hypothetical protein